MGLAGYGPVPEPGYYFEFYASSAARPASPIWIGHQSRRVITRANIMERHTFHVGGMNFGQADTTARCVGCHTGHSMIEVPEDASQIEVPIDVPLAN